jgi:2-polyprenyl-6-methoxyphenol hydroxylase-like FAD-dependent oxidoreductase
MSIGIVGAGISGLHLGLRLRQLGIDALLYATHNPEQIRTGRPVNFVTRFAHTRERERALGVDHWRAPEFESDRIHLNVEGEGGFSFQGMLSQPASSVDFRIYLAQLLEDYEQRGGAVVYGPAPEEADLLRLAEQHDLLVFAGGRGPQTELFPRDPARSPYTEAQRLLCGGFFHGIHPAEPPGMSIHMMPGVGEVHAPPFYSFAGRVTLLLFEAIPGGPLADLAHRDYAADPAGFERALLATMAEFAPGLRERVDAAAFGLTRPIDLLQGSVTPVVRRGWAELDNGRCAIAVGDAWTVNDPITAQGANLGSHCAFVLAEAIVRAGGRFGAEFCREVERAMWPYAEAVANWTNMFIGPPQPHLGEILATAVTDRRVADAFAGNLDDPPAMWNSIAGPEHAARFLAEARSAGSEQREVAV